MVIWITLPANGRAVPMEPNKKSPDVGGACSGLCVWCNWPNENRKRFLLIDAKITNRVFCPDLIEFLDQWNIRQSEGHFQLFS